jgi:hypothetical protein
MAESRLTDDVDFSSDGRLLSVGVVSDALVVACVVLVDAIDAQVRDGLA